MIGDAARMAKRGMIALREKTPVTVPDSGDVRTWVRSVRNYGVCVVPNFYDSSTCASLIDEINNLADQYPAAINNMSNNSDRRIFGAESASDQIRRFAEEPRLLNAARSVLAGDAANAFTLAGAITYRAGNLGSGEGWHRDSFFNQFKAIVYLTDVNKENGPFEYIMSSHHLRQKFSDHRKYGVPLRTARIGDSAMRGLITAAPERYRVFTAPAGTLLLVDPTGIHRGMPLKSGTRFALTNYYYPGKAFGPKLFEHFKPVLGRDIEVDGYPRG